MPRSDPIQGITTALGTESPDGATNEASIVDQIVPKIIMRFATVAARTSAIAAGATKAGMVSFVDATGYLETVRADAGAWVRLATVDTFLGTEAALVGSNPPAGTFKIRKSINQVVTVGAAGNVSYSYPGGAFPNGIVTVMLTPGDVAGNLGSLALNLAGAGFTLGGWQAFAYAYNGVVVTAGGAVRICGEAVGW